MEDKKKFDPPIITGQNAGDFAVIEAPDNMVQVKTAYTTAMVVPKARSITEVFGKMKEEAGLAGDSFYYSWMVYDKTKGRKVPIEGGSIDMARAFARNYGNNALDVKCEETITHYIFTVTFIDLESGLTLPRIFRQRKGQIISGKMDRGRQEDMVFQLAQSKAIRNAILQVMPQWMIETLIALAKDSELQSIDEYHNIVEARSKIVDFFYDYGISPERIEAERKKPVDKITAKDIVDLRAMARSVKDGEVTADSLFPEIESELKKPESKPPESKKRKPTNKKQSPEDRWQEIVKTDSKGALEVLDAFKAAHRDKETDFAWCVEHYEK